VSSKNLSNPIANPDTTLSSGATSANMKIRLLSSSDDPKIISEFYLTNSDHLCPWEPLRDEGFHTIEA